MGNQKVSTQKRGAKVQKKSSKASVSTKTTKVVAKAPQTQSHKPAHRAPARVQKDSNEPIVRLLFIVLFIAVAAASSNIFLENMAWLTNGSSVKYGDFVLPFLSVFSALAAIMLILRRRISIIMTNVAMALIAVWITVSQYEYYNVKPFTDESLRMSMWMCASVVIPVYLVCGLSMLLVNRTLRSAHKG